MDSSEAEVLFEILDLSGDGSIDKEDHQIVFVVSRSWTSPRGSRC